MTITEPPTGTKEHRTLRFVGLATVTVGILALWVAILEYQGNVLDRERNRIEAERKTPSVKAHVRHYEVPKQVDEVGVEELVQELYDLEDRYSSYTGATILTVVSRLQEPSDPPTEPMDLSVLFREIRDGVTQRENERSRNLPQLLNDLEDLDREWRRRGTVTQELLEELNEIESTYSAYTNYHVIGLAEDLQALLDSDGSRSDDALSEVLLQLEAARESIREDQASYDDTVRQLLEDVTDIEGVHRQDTEFHRLLVEVVVRNQSQLPTVVHKEGRIEFSDGDNTRQIDVTADEDGNLGPYSVGTMVFTASTLDTLEPEDVSFVAGKQERISCQMALLGLRGEKSEAMCDRTGVEERREALRVMLAKPGT